MAKTQTEGLRKYELMLIIKSNIPDTQRKQVLSKIKEMIKDFGGSVEEENVWGKRALAYPINKMGEGFYIVYNLFMNADKANEFKHQLNLNGDVMRYLLRSMESFEKITFPSKSESNEK